MVFQVGFIYSVSSILFWKSKVQIWTWSRRILIELVHGLTELSVAKCRHFHFRPNPFLPFFSRTRPVLLFLFCMSSVYSECSLSYSPQIYAVVTKVIEMLAFLRHVPKSPPQLFLPVYSTVVRLHIENCVQAWASPLYRDLAKYEMVWMMTTKCILGVIHLSWSERLGHFKLSSLRWRRLWWDLMETYKIFKGFVAVEPREFLSPFDWWEHCTSHWQMYWLKGGESMKSPSSVKESWHLP